MNFKNMDVDEFINFYDSSKSEDSYIDYIGNTYGVDPDFLRAIDKQESGGNAKAVSNTGVKGRFQFTESTAKAYDADRDNFESIADAAGRYVKDLSDEFDGEYDKILGAYNTGPAVIKEASRLAEEKGTDWRDEIRNTQSMSSVVKQIMKAKEARGAKVGSFEEEFEDKVKEVVGHREKINNYYTSIKSDKIKNMSVDDFLSSYEGTPTTTTTKTPSSQPVENVPYTGEDLSLNQSKKGFITSTSNSLTASALDLLSSVTRLPALATETFLDALNKTFDEDLEDVSGKTINDDIELPQWLKTAGGLSTKLTETADKLKTSKQTGTGDIVNDLVDDFKAGEYGKAVENLYYTALEQAIPSLGAVGIAAVTKNPSLAMGTMGASSAGGKYGELADRTDVTSGQRVQSSLVTGGLEAAFSAIDIKMFEPLIKGKSTNEARKIVADEIKKGLAPKIGAFVKGATKAELTNLGEFGNEALTQLSQDMADNVIGVSNYNADEMVQRSVGAGILGHVAAMPLSAMQQVVENAPQKKLQQQQPTTTPSTIAEQTQQEIQPTPEMAGQLPQETEDFAGSGTPEQFIIKYNEAKTEDDKQFLMSLLSEDELNVVNEQLATPEAIQTEEATTVAPTEEVTPEQPQTASEEPLILDESLTQEITNEEESKEAGQALLTEDTAVEQPTAESTPYIFEDLPETETEISPGMMSAYEQKPTSATQEFKEKIASGVYKPGEAATTEDIDNFIKENEAGKEIAEEMRDESDIPSVQTVPETQQSHVAPPASPKEITATEEQLKSVKEKVSGIEGIEFQGSNPGIEGKNKKTGESRFVPPTFEFKDKVSGGNFTLKEEDVTPERINIIVDGLRKNVKPEIEQKNPVVELVEVKPTEPVSTKQETTEKPEEVKTEVAPQPEETVTPVVQQGKAKTDLPKKEPTKYTYNDLMSIYEGDTRNGPKKIAEIAKAAGVEVAPKQRYYTTMYNYLLKHGSEEDASKAEKLFTKKASIDVSRNISAKQMERLETTGDSRTEGRQEVVKLISEIESESLVLYNEDKHAPIISKIVKDDKGNYKPVFTVDGYKDIIKVEDMGKGKLYLSVNTDKGGLETLERMKASAGVKGGKGSLVGYMEEVKNDAEKDYADQSIAADENEFQRYERNQKQSADEVADEATDTFQNSPEFEESMKMLSNMRASGVLSEEKYKLAVNKLMDDYDDVMTRYSTTGPREVNPSIKDEILSGKAAEMEVLPVTEKDNEYGRSIAKSIPEIVFNGAQEGMVMGKARMEPKLYFTIKGEGKKRDTFSVPLNATKEDIIAKMNTVKNKFKEEELKKKTAEVVKLFKNKDTLPEIRLDDSVKSRSGQRDRKLGKKDYGAITKEDGKPVILINPNIDPKEMIPTLIHELVGHYGASKVYNEIDIELAQHMRDLFEKDKGSKFTKQVYETYKDQIDKNPNVLFDEWVAKRFEEIAQEYFDENGNFIQSKYDNDKSILKKVYDAIKSLVGKAFDKWFQRDATEEEIRDAVKATLQRMPDVVPKTYDKVETRQSRKPQTTKKRKRVAPKQLTRGEKLGTYVTDFLHLRTADSAKKIKIRFYDFANRHFYSKIGEVSPESYRKQIFNLISKVKTPNDEYHKQALELVNEFSDFIDTTRAYNEYKKFKKTHEKWLNKDDTRLDGIKHTMSHIDKMYEQYSDYHNLKRVSDRVTVFRPFKAGTTELTNPSERYQRLIDNDRNWIDPNFTDKEGKHYYKITPAGREAINKLKRDLTDPETKQMFNTGTLNVLLNGIKEDIKTKFKDEIKLVKKEKKLNYEQGIVDILGQLNKFNKKTLSDIKNKTLRDSLKWIKEQDMTTSNLEYISEHLDNFEKGMFTKHIFDKLDKGRRDSLRFGQDMSDFLKDGLKDIPIDELRSYSDAFFSGSLSMITAEKARKLKTTNFKLKNRHGVAEDVKLTPSQRISVYMLSKSEDGIRHLSEGGFSLDKTGMIYKLSPEDIEVINNTVKSNTNEMKVVDLLSKYYLKQGRAINRVSNRDVGHDIAGIKNYHPILVRGDEVQKAVESISNLSQLREHMYKFSPSNLKARNGSSAPIILEGAFEALSRTSDLVEHYVGRAMPAKYVETILKDKQVQQTMNNKGLDVEYNTMRKLLDEYQKTSSFRSGVGDKFLRAVQNMFTVATLGYKVGTAALQIPGAYLFLNEMGKDQKLQTLKGLTKPRPGEVDKVIELISKWNPVLRNRFDNHVDRDWGEAANKYRTRNMFIGPEKLTPKNFIKKALSSEGAMSMITSIDRYTITQLWKGTEAYAEYKGLKRGSDEFYKFVSNEVERIVRITQPTYDVLDRPLVTQASPAFRALTMFTSQPIKMLAMTRRAIHQIKSGDRDKMANGIFGLTNLIILQPIMIESIRYAWKALRDDIDEEDYDEGLDIIKNLSANVVGMYPIIGSIAASALQGFKPNVGGPLQEVVNRSIDLTNTLLKSATEGVDTEKSLKAAKRLAEIWKPISGVEQIGKFFVTQYNNAIDFYHESRGR